MNARFLFLIASMLGLSGCYSHLGHPLETAETPATYGMDRIVENITYVPESWPQALQGDLYLPDRPGPRPVVLTIHGGGWANRDRQDMAAISENLAAHGYAVFNVNYRFAPGFQHPAQIRDLQMALAWLDRNADRYGLDRDRINTWGFSSGAHLAALIASLDPASPQFDPALPRPPVFRAVVAGGIPSDLRKYDDSPIVGRFLGGPREQMPQRYADASPAYHISEDDPPVFLYHGKLDMLVTPDQATDYYQALRDAGIGAELYLHRWLGHSTLFLLAGDAEDKAIAFLNRNNR